MPRVIVAAVLLLISSASPAICYGQVTSNVLLRTLLIGVRGVGTGTGFSIDVDGRQYLITAKHVVDGFKDGAKAVIEIETKSGPRPETVTVFKCAKPVDIAVLVPSEQLTVDFPLQASSVGLEVGQDSYFIGYPNGPEHAVIYPNQPYVFGFVKRATVAQLVPNIEADGKQHGEQIWLDGINNPGFSGSPVVWRDFSKSGVVFNVAAVISSFEYDAAPVLKKIEIAPNQATALDREKGDVITGADGKTYRLEDTGQVVKLNTGMAIAWDVGSAVELIKNHPIGPTVSDDFQP